MTPELGRGKLRGLVVEGGREILPHILKDTASLSDFVDGDFPHRANWIYRHGAEFFAMEGVGGAITVPNDVLIIHIWSLLNYTKHGVPTREPPEHHLAIFQWRQQQWLMTATLTATLTTFGFTFTTHSFSPFAYYLILDSFEDTGHPRVIPTHTFPAFAFAFP